MDNFRSMNFFNSGGWALLIFGANQNSSEIKILIKCMKFFYLSFSICMVENKKFHSNNCTIQKSNVTEKHAWVGIKWRYRTIENDIKKCQECSKYECLKKKRKINFDIQKWHFRCHPMVLGLNVALAGKINFATSRVNKCPVIRLF